VTGVGLKCYFPASDDREIEDHVYCTFEFPGKSYDSRQPLRDPQSHIPKSNSVVAVTYSSISTNNFEPYGECVMGNHGTMIVSQETDIMLYPHGAAGGRSTAVTVSKEGKGLTVLDASASTGATETKAVDVGRDAIGKAPVSRGYREEMEDFAYCVRMWNQSDKKNRRLPRCHGRVAMADAIIALTSNQAMHKKERIEFKHEWFDPASPEVPDPDMKVESVTA